MSKRKNNSIILKQKKRRRYDTIDILAGKIHQSCFKNKSMDKKEQLIKYIKQMYIEFGNCMKKEDNFYMEYWKKLCMLCICI